MFLISAGSNKPPALSSKRDTLEQNCDKKKIQKKDEHDLSPFCFQCILCFYCLNVSPQNGQGSNKPPDIKLLNPFGWIWQEKIQKKI